MYNLHSVSILVNNNLCKNPIALDTSRPGPSIAWLVGILVINIWHGLSARDVLAVAVGCIAVWCAFGLDHVACMSGSVCGEVLFRTKVAHLTMMFVRTMV